MPRANALLASILTISGTAAALLLARPWTPRLDFARVIVSLSATSKTDIVDQAILRNVNFLISNTELVPAVTAQPRTLTLTKPLWVDACEVTNGEFLSFSLGAFQMKHAACAEQEPRGLFHMSPFWAHKVFGAPLRPVGGVSFFDAYAYCGAVGGRLPTDEEWEAIAAGTKGRHYPWGDEPDATAWERNSRPVESKLECGLSPMTDTPEGVHDMATGVAEWTMGSYPHGLPAQSGGSALTAGWDLYGLNYLHRKSLPDQRSPFLGFRCVFDHLPTERRAQLRRIEPGTYPLGPPRTARLPQLLRSVPAKELTNQLWVLEQTQEQEPPQLDVATAEVSRRSYRRFLYDPLARLHLFAHPFEPRGHSYLPDDWSHQQQDLDAPVVGVSYWDAYAFAHWIGARLPTKEEWNYAASGGGRRFYPFGDVYHVGLAATRDAGIAGPLRSQTVKGDVTTEGIFEMAGNVSEWTQTHETLSTPTDSVFLLSRIVIKGGNYSLDGPTTTLVGFEATVPLQFRSSALGFRVVRDPHSN